MLVDDRITHTDHVGASSSHALPFCAFRMLRLGHSRRPPWPVFASAAQSTHIMSYRPNVVPRWSQMTGNTYTGRGDTMASNCASVFEPKCVNLILRSPSIAYSV